MLTDRAAATLSDEEFILAATVALRSLDSDVQQWLTKAHGDDIANATEAVEVLEDIISELGEDVGTASGPTPRNSAVADIRCTASVRVEYQRYLDHLNKRGTSRTAFCGGTITLTPPALYWFIARSVDGYDDSVGIRSQLPQWLHSFFLAKMASVTTIWERLQKVRGAHVALGVAASAISYGLVRTGLIPEQASIVGNAGPILVLVALLYVLVFDEELRQRKRVLVHIAMVGVLGVVFLYLFFVQTVHNYGAPGETRRFLVGAMLNNAGREAQSQLGVATVDQLIQSAGADDIPSWYGWDYSIVLVVFVTSYVVFVVSTVLIVGVLATQPHAPPNTRSRPTARERTRRRRG